MILRRLTPALLLCLALTAACSGLPSKLPDNATGRAARDLLAALEGGREEALRDFLFAHASGTMYNQMSSEKYLPVLKRLAEQSGGLDLVHPMVSPGRNVRMLVKSRKGGHLLAIELVPEEKDGARLVWIGLHPMREDPRKPAPNPWEVEGRLDEAGRVALMERIVGKAASEDRFSGVVLAAQGDRVFFEKAWGQADKAQGVPNTPETRFQIASMGKMFTAVAIAQLVEQGKLRFDETLAEALPGYPDPEAARRITLHHLLTHTAGLGDPFDSPLYERDHEYVRQEDWFPLFTGRPLLFEPGKRFEYSNGGYLVLGAVVERASGLSFRDYLREKILGPAGISSSGGGVPAPVVAVGYYHPWKTDPLGIEPWQPNTDFFAGGKGWGSGMGGESMTARDLFRFARALHGGKLLSSAMTERVVTGKVPVGPGDDIQYAYGFYYGVFHGERNPYHSGGGEGSGVDGDLELLWDSDYTVVVLGNYDTPAARSIAEPLAGMLIRQARTKR